MPVQIRLYGTIPWANKVDMLTLPTKTLKRLYCGRVSSGGFWTQTICFFLGVYTLFCFLHTLSDQTKESVPWWLPARTNFDFLVSFENLDACMAKVQLHWHQALKRISDCDWSISWKKRQTNCVFSKEMAFFFNLILFSHWKQGWSSLRFFHVYLLRAIVHDDRHERFQCLVGFFRGVTPNCWSQVNAKCSDVLKDSKPKTRSKPALDSAAVNNKKSYEWLTTGGSFLSSLSVQLLLIIQYDECFLNEKRKCCGSIQASENRQVHFCLAFVSSYFNVPRAWEGAYVFLWMVIDKRYSE